MSDTPRTDQFEEAYFAGLTTQFEDGFDFARELERENAALRASLNSHRDQGITLLDAKWLDPECHRGCQSLALKAENAALRADKERLDWLEKHGATPICSRAAIDAARKEQKP